MARVLLVLAALALSACSTLPRDVAAEFASPALQGARFGLLVTDLDGRELLAINPDQRFVPASNTKLFTGAAAFHRLPKLDQPDAAGAASLMIQLQFGADPPDIAILGRGDATLGDGPGCLQNCLSELADGLLTYGFTQVGDVYGDSTLFPDERWGAGWSWNNLETRSGTAVSALTVNANELAVEISPGAAPGQPAVATWRQGDDLYDLRVDAVTIATGKSDIWLEHRPNTNEVRIYGAMLAGGPPQTIRMGVSDPALLAARRLVKLLRDIDIDVTGEARALNRSVQMSDDPAKREAFPLPAADEGAMTELVRLTPPPLAETVSVMLKASQNLYAELLLRRLGRLEGAGSAADGLKQVEAILAEAGAPRSGWDLFDGSGMSTYNRVSPRVTVALLLWSQKQPWAEQFRSSLPVGGVDGTLRRRFLGTQLEKNIQAKTGSLNATNALAGFVRARSGRMLVFAIYANDVPSEAGEAIAQIDAALVRIAEAY